MEAGPATSLLYATGGNYVWSVAADAAGNAYVGHGRECCGSAAVMKVAADGKATKVFEGKELGVQALQLVPDGALLIATSPDGKVYRVPGSGGASGSAAVVLFDPAQTAEKPKYLWDVAVSWAERVCCGGGSGGGVSGGAGWGGEGVFAKPVLLFKTADQHIRCLLVGADGKLWAGSDGAGVIYRIAPAEKDAKPFAVYAAARKEITALAMDGSGNIYAAGVGTKGRWSVCRRCR